MASITLFNNGPHIPVEDLEKIFNPFYTSVSGGTGLGLSIVKAVVDAHGGSVGAENNPSGGARVTAEFPRVQT